MGKSRLPERNRLFRMLIFYGISLLLSLLVIVISTTVFSVLAFVEGTVSSSLFYLYLGVLACNILVAAFSLAGAIRTYGRISTAGSRVLFAGTENTRTEGNVSQGTAEMYLTALESSVVDALKKNSGRALQSQLALSLGTSKATLSRTLTSLENKGVVVRVRKGVTNEVILDSEISSK